MTRAFRNRMLREAAVMALGLVLLLFGLARLLTKEEFAPVAFVLIILTAFTFNFRQRRAMKAMRAEGRR